MLAPHYLRSCARCTSRLVPTGFLQQQQQQQHPNRLMTSTNSTTDLELPPEPTTCCLSGCHNCVWIEYAQSISKLFEYNDERVTEIVLSKIKDPNLKMFLTVELRYMKYLREQEAQENAAKEAK